MLFEVHDERKGRRIHHVTLLGAWYGFGFVFVLLRCIRSLLLRAWYRFCFVKLKINCAPPVLSVFFWTIVLSRLRPPRLSLVSAVLWGLITISLNCCRIWTEGFRVLYFFSTDPVTECRRAFLSYVNILPNFLVFSPMVILVIELVFHFRMCKNKVVILINEVEICVDWIDCLCLFARGMFWNGVQNGFLRWRSFIG